MDTEKFIECVKRHPVLYDTTHRQYKNFLAKNDIWEEIAKEMQEPSETLRTKWKGLKDGYTKYKKWVLYRKASAKSHSNWCWGPYLEFLEPFIHSRKRSDRDNQDTSFLHLEVSHSGSKDHLELRDSQNVLEEDLIENECLIKLEEVPTEISSPLSSRTQSRASVRDPITSQQAETDNTKLLTFIQNKRSKGVDAVDLLFMSYADSFKKFSLVTQSKLKVKMATIFAEAELQEHNLDPSLLS